MGFVPIAVTRDFPTGIAGSVSIEETSARSTRRHLSGKTLRPHSPRCPTRCSFSYPG